MATDIIIYMKFIFYWVFYILSANSALDIRGVFMIMG
jgi:hypothetical protein